MTLEGFPLPTISGGSASLAGNQSVRATHGITGWALAAVMLAPFAAPAFAAEETTPRTSDVSSNGTDEVANDAANETSPAAASAATVARGAETANAVGAADPPLAIYPTVVIADYVLGCMTANGNSYVALQECSCSIDFIRSRMDYDAYEKASTVMQVQLDQGQRGIFYRDSNWAKQQVERLQNLQAESTLRCF